MNSYALTNEHSKTSVTARISRREKGESEFEARDDRLATFVPPASAFFVQDVLRSWSAVAASANQSKEKSATKGRKEGGRMRNVWRERERERESESEAGQLLVSFNPICQQIKARPYSVTREWN